jgi:hypothetical protein
MKMIFTFNFYGKKDKSLKRCFIWFDFGFKNQLKCVLFCFVARTEIIKVHEMFWGGKWLEYGLLGSKKLDLDFLGVEDNFSD